MFLGSSWESVLWSSMILIDQRSISNIWGPNPRSTQWLFSHSIFPSTCHEQHPFQSLKGVAFLHTHFLDIEWYSALITDLLGSSFHSARSFWIALLWGKSFDFWYFGSGSLGHVCDLGGFSSSLLLEVESLATSGTCVSFLFRSSSFSERCLGFDCPGEGGSLWDW